MPQKLAINAYCTYIFLNTLWIYAHIYKHIKIFTKLEFREAGVQGPSPAR